MGKSVKTVEIDTEDSDTTLEAEGLDEEDTELEDTPEDTEDTDAAEDTDDEEDSEETEDDTKSDKDDTKKPSKTFTDDQQAAVNKIVKARLERQETSMLHELSASSGVDISREEVTNAAKLWGLLKANPKLSQAVDGLIGTALTDGSAKAPVTENDAAKRTERRMELKEAILDLKADDATFNKYATKILDWAKNEDYEVTDKASLKMAYLAWKGSQGKVMSAVQKTQAKQKTAAKEMAKKHATVQGTRSSAKRTGGRADYTKMADADVLAAAGLSLFTED